MKFKVGDKVRLRNDAVEYKIYNNITFTPYLREKIKDVNVITKVYSSGHCNIQGSLYMYDCTMFELVEDFIPEKLVIYRDGNKTIAKYYKGDKTTTAVSESYPEDDYDFETSAKLSMNKAIEKMKKEEIGYSFVKCVGYKTKTFFNFTVGEKYKVYDNGRITDDDGYTYTGRPTKEEVMKYLSQWYIFEEI